MRLELTPRAARDLEDIFDWSAETWGTEQAARYVRSLQAAMERILRFPELGRPIDDIKAGVRILPVESHIVVYRRSADAIGVVRILHGRMDILRHL